MNNAEILSHLGRVAQAQIHPAVTFGEEKDEFLTQILEVNPNGKPEPHLVLDELVPQVGQVRAKRLGPIRCTYRLDGQPMIFATQILRVVTDPHPAVHVAIPDDVKEHQLRKHYRVEPSSQAPVEIAEITIPNVEGDPEEQAKRCVLHDLSLGGLAINTEIPRSHLDPGTRIPRIIFRLPDGKIFKVQAIIRTVRSNAARAYRHRIGLEFFMLEPHEREQLNDYVIEKQRADIRRIKRELE